MSKKILYIYPHPDDESFGPAAAMHSQIKQGHEVYLLTLTKGGATKQRFKLGLSVEEMGEVRYKEMLEVEKVLGLSGMTVLDFPDSGLKEMDPRILEKTIQEHIQQIKPEIVVTYPVHGISGFHDHLITHAVVKRVYLEMLDNPVNFLKRLAFILCIFPDDLVQPLSCDRPGRYAVAPYIVGACFSGNRPREGHNRVFRGAVNRPVGRVDNCGNRSDINNIPRTTGNHRL